MKKQTLKVAGKEYPCRVTMGAMVRFKHETKKDVSQLSTQDMSELVMFIFCCVKSACNADGVEFVMDFDLFADSLEPKDINDFYDIMQEDQKKT